MPDMTPSPNMVATSNGIRPTPANFAAKPPNTSSVPLSPQNGGHEQLCFAFVQVILEGAHSALEDR